MNVKTIHLTNESFNKLMNIINESDASSSGEIDTVVFPIMRRSFAFKKYGEKPNLGNND